MQHFYDGQIKRYLTQFMRLMSNFSYKNSKGVVTQIPVRFGDMNRQVAQIVNKNSENIVQSAPFVACYIKGMDFARDRLQDPTYVNKINLRERAYDAQGNEYLDVQGSNYTIERLMPTPFTLQFTADIWTTNVDQKLQILEQILVLFNPSMEIQTTSNFIDWTSLSLVEFTGMVFSSRSIPQGLEQDIDIASLNFTSPIWLTTPAKVKKLGIITKIIASVFDDAPGTVASGTYADSDQVDYFTGRKAATVSVTTVGDFSLLVLDNTAKIIPRGTDGTKPQPWNLILDVYPGKFTAGLSQLRLMKPNGTEIIGYISLNPTDNTVMHINFDEDTIPMNTLISDLQGNNARGTIDAIIDPYTFDPRLLLDNGDYGWPATDTRYLILEDINNFTSVVNPETSQFYERARAWKNQDGSDFAALANDIIQWDGERWIVIFDAANTIDLTYVRNSRTGIQYVWREGAWVKSFEGIYPAKDWRLVL